jgi:hypothetical protein
MPVIKTKRLIPKHLSRNDLGDVYDQVYADPEVKNSWSGIKDTPEDLKERFAHSRS